MAGNPLGYWEADEVVQTAAIERRSSQVDERLVSDQGGLVDAREKMGRSIFRAGARRTSRKLRRR